MVCVFFYHEIREIHENGLWEAATPSGFKHREFEAQRATEGMRLECWVRERLRLR